MSRFLIVREVASLLGTLGRIAGGAVLHDPVGELIRQAGVCERAWVEPVVPGADGNGVRRVPEASTRLGKLTAAAPGSLALACFCPGVTPQDDQTIMAVQRMENGHA